MGALASELDQEAFLVATSGTPPTYAAYREYLKAAEQFIYGQWSGAVESAALAHSLDTTFVTPLLTMGVALRNWGR